MPSHKTSAWPLAQAYAALIVYASLIPSAAGATRHRALAFLASPWPNTGRASMCGQPLGYAPLGFLLALSFLRKGGKP